MAKVNTYGLTINGLKKTSGYTEDYGSYSGRYVEIFYDRSTGEVWGNFHCSLGHNSWTEYHDPDVVKICNTSRHMTMQEIADEIHRVLRGSDLYTRRMEAEGIA